MWEVYGNVHFHAHLKGTVYGLEIKDGVASWNCF